ncbi:CsbD family protein [Rhodococcus sp. 14C212]|uniref:CsbD family protein n=1 Tax=Rhodococcus sp. 14C212 TaxID=2711209 RepID=UPI0013EA8BA9|nr:CsbD family protein [Rhodococcus sp. 14C212]NGP05271.1 CsbD family protein [Rhodococcus sp. 14C212]
MADFIDKAKHKAEDVSGQAKEGAGRATGDRDLEAEGRGDQASSGLKQAGDKISDAAGKVKDSFKK